MTDRCSSFVSGVLVNITLVQDQTQQLLVDSPGQACSVRLHRVTERVDSIWKGQLSTLNLFWAMAESGFLCYKADQRTSSFGALDKLDYKFCLIILLSSIFCIPNPVQKRIAAMSSSGDRSVIGHNIILERAFLIAGRLRLVTNIWLGICKAEMLERTSTTSRVESDSPAHSLHRVRISRRKVRPQQIRW